MMIMSSGRIRQGEPRYVHSSVVWYFLKDSALAANTARNTNLKTLIDADMPSGATFFAITGWGCGSAACAPVQIRYVNSSYSLTIKNVTSSSVAKTSDTYARIYYIYSI